MKGYRISVIRHGRTAANDKGIYIGRTDFPLSDKGAAELAGKMDEFRYPNVARVYSSPLRRCTETAEILYPNHTPIYIPEWREMDFGEFEGKNYIELQKNPNYQAWIDSNGTLPFPGGESREEFKRRNVTGFQKAVNGCLRNGISLAALVVHGGTIMNVMEEYADEDRSFYDWHEEWQGI